MTPISFSSINRQLYDISHKKICPVIDIKIQYETRKLYSPEENFYWGCRVNRLHDCVFSNLSNISSQYDINRYHLIDGNGARITIGLEKRIKTPRAYGVAFEMAVKGCLRATPTIIEVRASSD